MSEAIDAALYMEPIVDFLGPLSMDSSVVDAPRLWKKIYLPAPCIRIFLRDLSRLSSPVQDCMGPLSVPVLRIIVVPSSTGSR